MTVKYTVGTVNSSWQPCMKKILLYYQQIIMPIQDSPCLNVLSFSLRHYLSQCLYSASLIDLFYKIDLANAQYGEWRDESNTQSSHHTQRKISEGRTLKSPIAVHHSRKASLPELISGVVVVMDASWQLVSQWNENPGMLIPSRCCRRPSSIKCHSGEWHPMVYVWAYRK